MENKKVNDASLLYLDPDKAGPFVIKPKPVISKLPPSDTLSRLMAFLPQIEKANEEIEEKAKIDPNSVIIDVISEEDAKEGVVEMDLMVVVDNSEESSNESTEENEIDDDTPTLFKSAIQEEKARKSAKKCAIQELSSTEN